MLCGRFVVIKAGDPISLVYNQDGEWGWGENLTGSPIVAAMD